jgi:hypothetical protein
MATACHPLNRSWPTEIVTPIGAGSPHSLANHISNRRIGVNAEPRAGSAAGAARVTVRAPEGLAVPHQLVTSGRHRRRQSRRTGGVLALAGTKAANALQHGVRDVIVNIVAEQVGWSCR